MSEVKIHYDSYPLDVGTDPIQSVQADQNAGLYQENEGGRGTGAQNDLISQQASAFTCVYDEIAKTYKILNPIVCTPSGPITATGADNLSTGSYYCKVSNEGGVFSAEITDSSETDENTVVIVPIADITANDGIHQKHIGTIIVQNTQKDYIAGEHTNIVFTPVTTGENKGKIMIDVFYL